MLIVKENSLPAVVEQVISGVSQNTSITTTTTLWGAYVFI